MASSIPVADEVVSRVLSPGKTIPEIIQEQDLLVPVNTQSIDTSLAQLPEEKAKPQPLDPPN